MSWASPASCSCRAVSRLISRPPACVSRPRTGSTWSRLPWRATSGSSWTGSRETPDGRCRSEEHTSELQSRQYLVCRLLLEKNTQSNLHLVLRRPFMLGQLLHRLSPTARHLALDLLLDRVPAL